MNKLKQFAQGRLKKLGINISFIPNQKKYNQIYERYKAFTMTPKALFIDNLTITEKQIKGLNGDIIECGVWKGGMIAGIADLCGNNRTYYLFDSFEGLPQSKEIDGDAALNWQKEKKENYYDNCTAQIEYAESAMKMTGCKFQLIKGWFDATLPHFKPKNKIALLRLDGDWYDSILICLQHLYPLVEQNGLIIIDDYFVWDGCARAVHDYLSTISSKSRIHSTSAGVCYIIKQD